MSNVFDVLKRNGGFDFGDIAGIEDVSSKIEERSSVVTLEPPLQVQTSSVRTARLRVPDATPIFPFEESDSIAAEQYRIIRTKILHHPKNPKVLAISSASSGDGKTVTSINIAASMALKQDTPVLLIDADLRRRSIARVLGLANSPGLSEVLCGLSGLDAAFIQAEQLPNLSILTAGDVQASPAELLDPSRLRSLIEDLKQQFSYVIFDATPVAAVADYALIEAVCDGVVAVARPGHTDRAACFTMLQAVPKEKLIGIVLNCAEDWWLWKTPQYGYFKKK